ncbi:hypothetical protein G9A89_016244 [Geosiphon pyriformis]|nr:hypothetical protein G9A89_016244 [Geosiphon pyriformis]
MLLKSTNRALAGLHTYFMKAVYEKLPVAIRKRLYDKCYLVVESLLSCLSDIGLYALLCKGFVLVRWFEKTVQIFEDYKKAV